MLYIPFERPDIYKKAGLTLTKLFRLAMLLSLDLENMLTSDPNTILWVVGGNGILITYPSLKHILLKIWLQPLILPIYHYLLFSWITTVWT